MMVLEALCDSIPFECMRRVCEPALLFFQSKLNASASVEERVGAIHPSIH
jgi:hypothetical protein